MEYRDNYPNGYKEGYDSWDDPDRKDYSPYGVERARREAGSGIRTTGDSALDWSRRRQRAEEEKNIAEANDRKREETSYERRRAVTEFIAKQKRENLSKRSPLTKFIAKIKGEKANKIWMQTFEQAQAEVGRMSQDEIDDFYRSHVR